MVLYCPFPLFIEELDQEKEEICDKDLRVVYPWAEILNVFWHKTTFSKQCKSQRLLNIEASGERVIWLMI